MIRFNTKLVTATVAVLLCGLFATAAPSMAHADEDEVPGEVVLSTKFEFVKFTVNGKTAWENHEYTSRNKTLVILGLSREDDNTIVLTPRVDGYEPLTLVIKPSDFKRKRVRKKGKRIAVFQFKKRVKFAKAGSAKPAPKAKPKAKKKKTPKKSGKSKR